MSETKIYHIMLIFTALIASLAVFLAAGHAQELAALLRLPGTHVARGDDIIRKVGGDSHNHIEKVITKPLTKTPDQISYASTRRDTHLSSDEVREQQTLFERWWFAARFLLAVMK